MGGIRWEIISLVNIVGLQSGCAASSKAATLRAIDVPESMRKSSCRVVRHMCVIGELSVPPREYVISRRQYVWFEDVRTSAKLRDGLKRSMRRPPSANPVPRTVYCNLIVAIGCELEAMYLSSTGASFGLIGIVGK